MEGKRIRREVERSQKRRKNLSKRQRNQETHGRSTKEGSKSRIKGKDPQRKESPRRSKYRNQGQMRTSKKNRNTAKE